MIVQRLLSRSWKRTLQLSRVAPVLLAASCASRLPSATHDRTDWQARAAQVTVGITRDQVTRILVWPDHMRTQRRWPATSILLD